MKIEKAWLIAASIGLVTLHFIGCSDEPTPKGASGSSSSGSSSTSSASSSGDTSSSSSSSGKPPECTVAADCKNNGPADFCGEPECANGKCGRKGLQTPGTALMSQLYGDCQKSQCDATFNIAVVPDDMDFYDDAKECTTDKCTNGVLTHEPVAAGTLCTELGSQGICDGNGACVPCVEGGMGMGCAAPKVCQVNKCVGAKCVNGSKDPGESDIDCGAPASQCQPCADGKTCTNPTQCASGVCMAGMCAAPTCSDMSKNGKETGFDCGGPDCSKCPTDEGCATPNDCQSGVCKVGVCIKPECTDAVQNGDEAGIDCGGSCPNACPP